MTSRDQGALVLWPNLSLSKTAISHFRGDKIYVTSLMLTNQLFCMLSCVTVYILSKGRQFVSKCYIGFSMSFLFISPRRIIGFSRFNLFRGPRRIKYLSPLGSQFAKIFLCLHVLMYFFMLPATVGLFIIIFGFLQVHTY